MNKCLVEVWNSSLNKSEWIEGEITGECLGDAHENFNRINVKTKIGIFEGCHPDCVKIS